MAILQDRSLNTPLFRPQYDTERCLEALRSVLESGWTGYGPASFRFEKEWSSYVNASHSLFVNSATSALHIALRLANLKQGSHVLTSPLTFLSPNAVILHEGHIPIFVDIDPENLAMSETDFFQKLEKYSAQAAIWVHYAGFVSSQFYNVESALRAHAIPLIQDCAHAAGAAYRDQTKVGSQSLSCFSYGAVKNLPTFESGMLTLSSPTDFERAQRLSYFGLNRDVKKRLTHTSLCRWHYDAAELGWKYNGNDIAAAIASVQLQLLDEQNADRLAIYLRYQNNLQNHPHIRFIHHAPFSSHYSVHICSPKRGKIMQALQKRNISCGIHESPSKAPSVFTPYYNPKECPVFEQLCQEMLSLPNYLGLTEEEIDTICDILSCI